MNEYVQFKYWEHKQNYISTKNIYNNINKTQTFKFYKDKPNNQLNIILKQKKIKNNNMNYYK